MSEKKSSPSATTALAVAVIALIVGLAAIAIPLIAPATPSAPAASSVQLTALQGQLSQLQSQVNSLPTVTEKPTTRNIVVEWTQLSATGSFTVTKPGIYRYFCFYHQSIGMFGWLVVLPNKGYTGS
jgi:type II secretory pathway pseudopilin PulG